MDIKQKKIKNCMFHEDDQYIWLLYCTGSIKKISKYLCFGKVRLEMEKE